MDQYERRFWVGATDQEIEQYWVWVDGSDVSRNYFHPNEPNNAYSGIVIVLLVLSERNGFIYSFYRHGVYWSLTNFVNFTKSFSGKDSKV